jgi:GT2 family glycosyltransferase
MLICVIHTYDREDRYRLFIKEFAEQGVSDYHIIKGQIDRHYPVVGIAKSHKRCVQYAKDTNAPYVIILENDVMFTHLGAFDRFKELSKQLPEDWKLFMGGVYDGKLEIINNDLAKVSNFSGLHCYMVNSSFYNEFLGLRENINLDKSISSPNFNNTSAYLAYPMIAMQYDTYSDNVKHLTSYNANLIKKFEVWKG